MSFKRRRLFFKRGFSAKLPPVADVVWRELKFLLTLKGFVVVDFRLPLSDEASLKLELQTETCWVLPFMPVSRATVGEGLAPL